MLSVTFLIKSKMGDYDWYNPFLKNDFSIENFRTLQLKISIEKELAFPRYYVKN